jgi:hypothetical protein
VQYSNDAFEQKAACKLRDRELVNSSSYRNPIGSDQDLLEFLVSSEQIPQSSKAIIFDSRFYFIENALCLDEWHRDQIGSRRGRFIADDVNGVIQIANKSVPFTHFQSDFTRYAAAYLAASDLFIPNWVLRRILRYTITDEGVWPNRGFSAFSRIGRRDRDNVVRRFTDSPSRMAAMLDFLFAARKPHLKRSAPNKVQREVVVAK